MRRLVRGVHEPVAVRTLLHGHDGVVEIGPRHLGVHLRAHVDEHGVGADAGDAQEHGQERGLVAADAVAVLERDVHVVRLVAGRAVLEGEPHVADLLRHELEHGAELRLVRGASRNEAAHLVRHRRRGGGEVRRAEAPVPARDGGPVLRRGEADRLHARGERRHVRLGERLRHVAHVPPQERAAGGERTVRRAHDRFLEGMAHDDVSHGVRVGLVHGVHGGEDRRGVLEELHVRPRAGHAGLARALCVADMAHLAHGEAGDGAAHLLVERVHDVRIERGVVRGDLERAREVHGADLSVGAHDFDGEDLRVAVALGEVERDGGRGTASLFREHLHPFVVPGDLGAVRLVGHVDAVVHHHAVGVGEARGGGGVGGGHDRLGVGEVLGGHVGDLGRADGDDEDREDREDECVCFHDGEPHLQKQTTSRPTRMQYGPNSQNHRPLSARRSSASEK